MKYELRGAIKPSEREELAEHSDLTAQLLTRRGIYTSKDAQLFFAPDYDNGLHDPFLLPDMERAVERILGALLEKEKVVIYSDYDSDGIPGGVLLHDFFKKIGYEHFDNYIPHRHKEGYGLSKIALDTIAENGASLVITVDCGIADIEEALHAKKLGIDLIVTDHHLVQAKLPDAYAVVNPKRKDSQYPFDGLCGSGVAYKLVQALVIRGNFSLPKGWEKWWLDMVGLATIADMVPLVDENRVLAHYGLTVLRKSPRPGLLQLCRKIGVQKRFIDEDDVGFMIAPRINAASRMDKPETAFALLVAEGEEEAGALAKHLDTINNERKGVVASMVREMKQRLSEKQELRSVIVMGNPSWRPSLLGLAANSLVEAYTRPVFLWGREGGTVIKGSCRSFGELDVMELMSVKKELFLEFGGHKYSGGFSLSNESVHILEEAINEAYDEVARELSTEQVYSIDAELSLDAVTWELFDVIKRFAPFGIGNEKPLFAFPSVEIVGTRAFGRDEAHKELSFAKSNGASVPAIQFFAPDAVRALSVGDRVDLLANIERTTFAKQPHLRLRIVAVEKKGASLNN